MSFPMGIFRPSGATMGVGVRDTILREGRIPRSPNTQAVTYCNAISGSLHKISLKNNFCRQGCLSRIYLKRDKDVI